MEPKGSSTPFFELAIISRLPRGLGAIHPSAVKIQAEMVSRLTQTRTIPRRPHGETFRRMVHKVPAHSVSSFCAKNRQGCASRHQCPLLARL